MDWGFGPVYGSVEDYVGGTYFFLLKPPVSDNYKFTLYVDDSGKLELDGTTLIDISNYGTDTETMFLDSSNFYYGYVEWTDIAGGASFYVDWEYPGQTQTPIPPSALYYPEYIASEEQITIQCGGGFYQSTVGGRPQWDSQWGDGYRVGTEQWDDAFASGGWDSNCNIISDWVWDGGNNITGDTCQFWTNGFYQDDSSNPRNWITRWNDGIQVGTEKWDDGNNNDGDGCKGDWSEVEDGYIWNNPTPLTADVCTKWPTGYYPDDTDNPTVWISEWGDGIQVGSEVCDDGNTDDTDGCKGDWSIVEAGYAWNSATFDVPDNWVFWTSGLYPTPSSNPTTWEPECGDGIEVSPEVWDDGNTNNNDGWKSDWSGVEDGWVWVKDAFGVDQCEKCDPGYYQNDQANPTVWVTKWGDGIRVGSEKWDDNNLQDGDGCKFDWSGVEDGHVCSLSSSNFDVWTKWSSGLYQNDEDNPTEWVSICGDGFRAGEEAWDDGNNIESDGCSSTCLVEKGWKCNGGNGTTPDIWTVSYRDVPLTSEEKAFQGATLGMSGVSAVSNIALAFLSVSSSHSIFQMINQIQLLLLLLLLNIYLPLKVANYIRSLVMALVEFNIDFTFLPVVGEIVDTFDYEQPEDDFYVTELESGSSLMNISGVIMLIIATILFHWLLRIILAFTRMIINKFTAYVKFLLHSFKYGIYVRIFFQSFILLWLASFSEIYRFNFNESSQHSYSMIVAFIMAIFIISSLLLMIIGLVFSSDDPEGNDKWLNRSLFEGLKINTYSRSYPLLFWARRFLLCFLIWCKLYKLIHTEFRFSFPSQDLIPEFIPFDQCYLYIYYTVI